MSGLIVADYDGQPISFNDDGWFNATEAAAKFGKRPNDWLALPTTVEYITALTRKYQNLRYLKTQRGAGGGTWMHPKLAVPFARWLDTDFAVWCDDQIDALLRGRQDWHKLRHEAASSFKVMQQILQMSRAEDGKACAPHHYSNEARLVNFALTGAFRGLDRDSLPAHDLTALARLEERNAVLIARGLQYDKRKLLLEQFAIDLRTPRIGAPA